MPAVYTVRRNERRNDLRKNGISVPDGACRGEGEHRPAREQLTGAAASLLRLARHQVPVNFIQLGQRPKRDILKSMEHIGKHMQVPSGRSKKEKVTERGELMKYFMDRLNAARLRDGLPPLTMPRMGRLLVAIPTKDLYYLKSVCDQSKDFSKKFWWEINPKKHEKNNAN